MDLKEIYSMNINNNKKYFFALIDEYGNMKTLPERINIFTVRQLLEEIILECQSNKLINKTNNSILSKKLDEIMKNNFLVSEHEKASLNYLKEKINERNAKLAYAISSELKKDFSSRKYFDSLVDSVNLLLTIDDKDESENINKIVDNIFIELFNKGYSMEQIAKNINNFFKDFSPINEKYNSQNSRNIYDTERITNSDIFKKSVNLIKKLYTTKKYKFTLVVPINGISVTNNIIKCNKDIFIYNPNYLNLFSLNYRADIFKVDYSNCANICIKIDASNYENAYVKGIKEADNYINILKLLSANNNLSIIKNYKVLLNEKNEEVAFISSIYDNDDYSSKRKFDRNMHPIDENDILNDERVMTTSKHIRDLINMDDDKQNSTKIALLNSIEKYSEGLESKTKQEAVLKFWSSIESLFNNNPIINNSNDKVENIKEVLSSVILFSIRALPLHDLYSTLAKATNLYMSNSQHRNDNATIIFPIDLLKKTNLFEISNKPFSLAPLIKYNNELQKHLDDYYYLKKVKSVKKYFSDKEYAHKFIKEKKKKIESDIYMIYRLRNQIIHNASSNSITTEFYLSILRKISSIFLNAVLDEYVSDKNQTISQIILKLYTKSILFINNTKNMQMSLLIK